MADLPAPTRPVQVVFWELTKACDLACPHCRAFARRRRDPRELSTAECCRVLDQISAMGSPVVVYSGGDPMQREDLYELIAYARAKELRVGVTPAATPRLTQDAMAFFQLQGVSTVVLSLDTPDGAAHDAFRRSPGAFGRTLDAIRYLRSLGVPTWINTALLPALVPQLDDLAALLAGLDVQAWNLLAVVPVGRGQRVELLAGQQYEDMFNRIYELSVALPFNVHVSYAPQYRRVVYQRLAQEGALDTPRGQALLAQPPMAGDGSLFIDHQGEVCPSGVFAVSAGNVRATPLAALYDAEIFQAMREPARITGHCQECEFLALCRGGSRARAYALTGDYLASDPVCAYAPMAANT